MNYESYESLKTGLHNTRTYIQQGERALAYAEAAHLVGLAALNQEESSDVFNKIYDVLTNIHLGKEEESIKAIDAACLCLPVVKNPAIEQVKKKVNQACKEGAKLPVKHEQSRWHGPDTQFYLDALFSLDKKSHPMRIVEMQASGDEILLRLNPVDKEISPDLGAAYQHINELSIEYWCDHEFECWYFASERDLTEAAQMFEDMLDENEYRDKIDYDCWDDDDMFRLVCWNK